MADNRISLRCVTCGAEIVLSKYFGGHWGLQTSSDEKGKELYDFIEEHQHEQWNDRPFELIYEDDEYNINNN